MDVNRTYAALCAVFALVQRQRCLLHLLLLRRRKRRRDDFIFRCRPLHADPVRAPRMHMKRRARNRDTYADAPERTGNALYFRDWRDGSTFSQYLNLTPPNDYEPEPECEAVLRGEFAAKIRLPFHTFHALYERMNTDAFMEERSTACPLKIKLTGALLYLAYGCPWDAVENQVNVDKRTLRDWFWNKFIPWMLDREYPNHVRYPQSEEELRQLLWPYEHAGFPGAIGCTDGVHVPYGAYRSGRRYMYADHHGGFSLGFNVTCDYHGRIIYVSEWSAGNTNDKTKINDDHFQSVIMREDPLYTQQRSIVRVSDDAFETIQGVYVLSDDGYHRWPTTVSSIKRPIPSSWDAKWTRWHESLRKEIECVFGIMKKKFAILAHPMTRHHEGDCESVVKVCACLYNMTRPDPCEEFNDWRRVNAADMHRVYGPNFDVANYAYAPEPLKHQPPTMHQTRSALTKHFKYHFEALRNDKEHEVLNEIAQL